MALGVTTPGPLEREVLRVLSRVQHVDPTATARAWERLDSLTKPPRSLGRLEDIAARISTVQDDVHPSGAPAAVALFAGDHGVTAEGVSPWPSEVTWQMVANFSRGGAAVNQLAAHVNARLVIADVGVLTDTGLLPGVLQMNVRRGTENIAMGPAMTREEAAAAIMAGVSVARDLTAEGVMIVGAGEMGIGNTTSASALTAALTGVSPAAVVGRGTGLDEAGVARKAHVVTRALEANPVPADDPLGALAALGGLEIAAMAGVVIGASSTGICVVADGYISGVAALLALRMCPACAGYLFPSHLSAEPGHALVLRALDLTPVLDLDMRLGEGTGAALAIGIMGAACRMMSGMATFSEAGVSGREDA